MLRLASCLILATVTSAATVIDSFDAGGFAANAAGDRFWLGEGADEIAGALALRASGPAYALAYLSTPRRPDYDISTHAVTLVLDDITFGPAEGAPPAAARWLRVSFLPKSAPLGHNQEAGLAVRIAGDGAVRMGWKDGVKAKNIEMVNPLINESLDSAPTRLRIRIGPGAYLVETTGASGPKAWTGALPDGILKTAFARQAAVRIDGAIGFLPDGVNGTVQIGIGSVTIETP